MAVIRRRAIEGDPHREGAEGRIGDGIPGAWVGRLRDPVGDVAAAVATGSDCPRERPAVRMKNRGEVGRVGVLKRGRGPVVEGPMRRATLRAVRLSGVANAIYWLHRNHAGIAMYHDPRPDVFESHLRYHPRHFRFTTLDTIVDAILAGDWSKVPKRALAVTIDDGHSGNHALLPVIRKYGIRPTIFLCSGIIGTTRRFWFNEEGIDPERLKQCRNADRLEALLQENGFEPEREYDDGSPQALSLEQIAEMSEWVDFAAHTQFHPILTRCDDEEAWREVAESRRELEKLLPHPCRHFAYPNGDHDDRVVDIVRRSGFDSARTTILGWNDVGTDPYRLRYLATPDRADVDRLVLHLTGITIRLRQTLRRLIGRISR
jgi:peptidoglycan/xylan/chitin deacetylase (PgdA/CDA1 family)